MTFARKMFRKVFNGDDGIANSAKQCNMKWFSMWSLRTFRRVVWFAKPK